MNFFQLGESGFGSYYPPAVRSMMDSWHNFFFASYDPGGFVTVDKPPLGLWLQVLSAKIFGFNPVSILLPQVLSGVLAVLVLYYLVKSHFGVVAGLLAALVGIGLVTMWHDYRQPGWRGWLLPVALAATMVEQIYLLNAYPAWSLWMTPLIIALGLLAIVLLLGMRPRINAVRNHFLRPVLGVGLAVLLFAPIVWSITPILLSKAPDTLLAGPPQGGGSGSGFIVSVGSQTFTGSIPASAVGSNNMITAQSRLVRYLEANQGQTKFLVATPNSQGEADQIILATNRPVMAMSGFSNDPILTTSQLATLIKHGTVRFFLLPTSGRLTPQILDQLSQQARELIQAASSGQSPLTTWVTQHCQAVPTSLWQSASTGSTPGLGSGNQLYDCAATH